MHSKHFEKVQKTWFDNTYEGEMLLYVKKNNISHKREDVNECVCQWDMFECWETP